MKPAPASAEAWLTAQDVADRLKISRSAAFALVRKLPRLKMGRITRVSEADFAAHLAASMLPGRREPTAAEAEHDRARRDWETRQLVAASSAAPKSNGPPRSKSIVRPPIQPTRPRRSAPFPVPPFKGG